MTLIEIENPRLTADDLSMSAAVTVDEMLGRDCLALKLPQLVIVQQALQAWFEQAIAEGVIRMGDYS